MGETQGRLGSNPFQIDAGEVHVAVAVAVRRGLLRHSVGLQGCCSALAPLQECKSTLGENRVVSTQHPALTHKSPVLRK